MIDKNHIEKLVKSEEGATAVEYAILIAGLGLVILAAVNGLLGGITGLFQKITEALGGS